MWGKTDRDNHDWLPLVQHLEDAADVMGHLWDTWVPRVVRGRLAQTVGDDQSARELAVWLAGVHDIGKATPAFAEMARDVGMGDLTDAMERHGLRVPRLLPKERPHHSITGHLAVQRWLQQQHGFSADRSNGLASVIGAHHGKPPEATLLHAFRPEVSERAWGTGAWDEVRTEILEGMASLTDVSLILPQIRELKFPLTGLIDLSALVIIADWLASDAMIFPYDVSSDSSQRLARALRLFDLPEPWTADEPSDVVALLHERFPHLSGVAPGDFQRATVSAAASTETSPLIVVEAPTGSGKSEAALMAAEVLAARHGCGGVFVALPTMATSDAMFGRVLDWIEHLPGGETSTWLAHGKAALNDDFAGLRSGGRVRGVSDEDAERAPKLAVQDEQRTSARVSSWLSGRKKGLLANFVVGTIDQVLMGGLQSRHLALRHLALSSKVVIVDEVHAADDYMRGYLTTILRYLGAYGTPVVLLSATLPPEQRDELVRTYREGRLHQQGRPSSTGRQRRRSGPTAVRSPDQAIAELPHGHIYPRITVVTHEMQDVPAKPPPESRTLQMQPLADDMDVLLAELDVALTGGGCVAVIRNTVRRAQETYDVLHDRYGDDVELLHSRFMAPHRAAKERGLLARLGPPGRSHRPDRLIVVGTQVLEQSLDIDVDLLVTDVAPVDLVLQRIGRLHRHERPAGHRPEAMSTPRVLLTGVKDWTSAPPTFDPGVERVYDAARLLRSVAVLSEHLGGMPVRLPQDVPGLVRRGYSADFEPPEDWHEHWSAAEADAAKHRNDQQSRSMSFRVPEVHRKSSLVGWMPAPQEERTSDGGQAQVRDSEDGIEVILVREDGQGRVRTLPGDFDGADRVIPEIPDDWTGLPRQVASCTVRLPKTMTMWGRGDRTVESLERVTFVEGWQQSKWLQGQLVLPLREDLTATIADHDITYDNERGLAATRAKVNG